jgi:hypothetical protein
MNLKLRNTAIAALVFGLASLGLWQIVRWALAPGFWGGSFLGNYQTPLEEAQAHFGPVLLVRWWIRDAPGTWGSQGDTLQLWGQHESAARLILVIVILWLALGVQWFVRARRKTQPCTPPNGDPVAPFDNSSGVKEPPSVS